MDLQLMVWRQKYTSVPLISNWLETQFQPLHQKIYNFAKSSAFINVCIYVVITICTKPFIFTRPFQEIYKFLRHSCIEKKIVLKTDLKDIVMGKRIMERFYNALEVSEHFWKRPWRTIYYSEICLKALKDSRILRDSWIPQYTQKVSLRLLNI